MTRRFNIETIGCALALLVVVLLPAFVGFLPMDVSSAGDPAVATGDASAASLHALGRSLQVDILPGLTLIPNAATPWNQTRYRASIFETTGATSTTVSTIAATSSARLL